MRLLHAVLADIRFQIKQGFYFVYVIITAMYLILHESFKNLSLGKLKEIHCYVLANTKVKLKNQRDVSKRRTLRVN